MIGPFEGPQLKIVPHARLFYQISDEPSGLWSGWPKYLEEIDSFVEEHPRLHFAHNSFFLYFFGPEAKEAWVGREVIGHTSQLPKDINSFDSFKGEVFEWNLSGDHAFKLLDEQVFEAERQLRTLAGEALAPTWRLKLDIEKGLNGATNPTNASFQFYKLV